MTTRLEPTPSNRAAPRLIVAALVAIAVMVAVLALRSPPTAVSDPAPGYQDVLDRVDLRYRGLLERAEGMPDAWTAFEWAAGAALQRARLSGSFEDYAAADALLDRAFDISGVGGPHLSRARLNYALHRFDAALADLEVAGQRLLLPDAARREIAGLRADIAFHQGRYPEALAGYRDNLRQGRSATDLYRLAYYSWQTGDYLRAEALLEQAAFAAGDLDPQLNAFWHLQRGLIDLDRGRYAEAFEHYLDADAALPGWWLAQEHLAEIHVLEGRLDEAEAIYLQVIEQTGNPEFMDAMASLAAERGRDAEAIGWVERAREAYDRQLALLPEAALGHALGHFLTYEQDSAVVLALAERNHALRPGGESALLLAQANLRAGRIDEAARIVDGVLAGPWRSAELHATAAAIYRAGGDEVAAATQLERMRAVNPAFAPYRLGSFVVGE